MATDREGPRIRRDPDDPSVILGPTVRERISLSQAQEDREREAPFSISGTSYKPIVDYQRDMIIAAHPELTSQFQQDPATGRWGIPQETFDAYGGSLIPWQGGGTFLNKMMNPIGKGVTAIGKPIARVIDKYPFQVASLGAMTVLGAAGAGAGTAAGGAEAGTTAGAGAGAGAGAAANQTALYQMAFDAGLEGAAADAFVASGGTLGSTAAGGLGVGTGAVAGGLGYGVGGLTEAQALELAGTEMTPAELAAAPGGVPEIQFTGPPMIPGAGGMGGAGGVAAGSAISRIIDGTATTADWVSVLGTAGATGLGMFSANQKSNSLERLAAENRADRAPFLGAATNWLNNPEAYWSGPGQASLDANLRRLSASHGNPISSPTALGIASKAGLMDWRDAVTGFGNMGLSGADTRANLGIGAAGAQADIWGNLAGGISDIVNPRRSLADLMRDYSLMVGGARV